MTEQISAEDVREIVEKMRYHANHDNVRGSEEEYIRYFADRLDALFPAPPRPTLADMTPAERRACRRMQCDVEGRSMRYVIANPHDKDGEVTLLDSDGGVDWVFPEYVTPRPDLPRMEWPDDTPTGPDTLAVGTGIESADDPRIAALPVGTILLDRNEEATTKRYWGWSGAGYGPVEDGGAEFGPWTVLHIPKEDDQ